MHLCVLKQGEEKYSQNKTINTLVRNVPHRLCENNQIMNNIYPVF